MNATPNEINKAFRASCLAVHPDRGGTEADFILVNTKMTIIRELWEEQKKKNTNWADFYSSFSLRISKSNKPEIKAICG